MGGYDALGGRVLDPGAAGGGQDRPQTQGETNVTGKKPTPTTILPGHPPPPLPEVDPALAELLTELAAIEALSLGDPRAAQLRREALEARRTDPQHAEQLLRALPMDMGQVPDNLDPAATHSRAQRQAMEAAFTEWIHRRLARENTFCVLYAIAAHNAEFQTRALATLASELGPSATFAAGLFAALTRAPTLSPALAARVRHAAVVRPPTLESGPAIAAAFRQGWAEELLWPSLQNPGTMADHQLAKQIVEIGASHGFFAKDSAVWQPRLTKRSKWADRPYDWRQGDEGRAPLQLGFAAREALASLANAAQQAASPDTPTKPRTRTRASQRSHVVPPSTRAVPIDRKRLRTARAREAALDALGAWIVDVLAHAEDAQAPSLIASAIAAFYDIREAAGQPRGEYAGHFFLCDGVGIDESDRPVPWEALRARIGIRRAKKLAALFGQVERDVM